MLRRLATTVVIVLGLLTAADAAQVQHPVNGPSSSTTNHLMCWNNATGSASKNCDFGSAGQCLISNGPGVAPTWQTCTGGGGGGTHFVLLNASGHISLNAGGSVICNAC